MSKKKNKKKNILALLSIILLAAILSEGVAYFLVTFFRNQFKFVWTTTMLYDKATLIVAGLIFAVCLFAIFFVFFKYIFVGYEKMISKATDLDSSLYGSSEWQTQAEMDSHYMCIPWNNIGNIANAEGFLLSTRLGKDGVLRANRVQDTHALILATTRVGKSTFWLAPEIQYLGRCPNKPSMLITDPKGELYSYSSKLLKEQGYNIFVFNLKEPTKSHKYNPLGVVWDFYQIWLKTKDSSYLDNCEAMLREIASTIAPVEGKDPTWDTGAQNIIQGICLAMLEDSEEPKYGMTKEKFTISQINSILSQGDDNFRDFALRRKKTSLARQRLMQYVNNAAKETMGSFIITTTNKLNQYVDTGMTYLMSDSELNMDEISEKPYAIFCIVPDDNTSRHPLAVLFASQIYKYLIHIADLEAAKGRGQKLPNSFYFLLEEFGNFPKMSCIEQMLSIGGGRRIWTCIILQSLSQIRKVYEKDVAETILNNLQLQIYMGTNENETNKYYSEFFGSKTVKKNSVQLASADLTKDVAGSASAEKVQLILPDELSRLQLGEIVLKVFRHQPCRTHLLPIFDKTLQKNKTFTLGAFKFDWHPKPLNMDALFYDLTERDNHYDNIDDIPIPPEYADEIETNIDERDNDISSEDITTASSTLERSSSDIILDYLHKINKE